MRKIWLGIAGWLCMLAFPAWAQSSKLPWEEYERLVEKGRSIAPLDVGSMFGDKVDLYSGALSFSATDVSIPGNSGLPVAISRKLSVHDRKGYGAGDSAFADWGIDIPNLNGVFVTPWHDTRCTQAVPPTYAYRVSSSDYWAGNHADMPGGGEMLRPNPNHPKPTTGGPYLWVTAGDVYFSCLGTIKNGSGQGFLAITKDGTRYWFDHMAQYAEPSFTHVVKGGMPERMEVSRYKNVLYATRIEDRFGNWVTYTYNNTATQRARLTQIASNDGRSLTLQYHPTTGYVSSVSNGSRTWTYQYTGSHLTGVVLPDTSKWVFNLAALTNTIIEYPTTDDVRSCFTRTGTLPFADVSGSITHPSGALASFTVALRRLGRTNVPGFCINYQPLGFPANDFTDDYPVFPYYWPNIALKSKQVEGPGLTTGQWTYEYTSAHSWAYAPGHSEPICETENCADPFCTSDDCAGTRTTKIVQPDGSWVRYVFGNSYRYNEGKLLAQETGDSAGSVLKTALNTYNYATSGQPYEAQIGTSPQSRGLGFVDEYPRPLVKTETLQDGGTFVWEVAKGCTTAGVYCLDALIRPTKVVKAGTVVGPPTGGTLVIPPTQTPTLTAPASNNTGSFTVSWTGVPQATAYELQERLGGGSWGTIQNSGAISSVMAGKPSGAWSYQVRGCNSAGCTAWSTIKTTDVLLPPASAPTLTAPATNTTGGYSVSWTAITAATRYELEQRKDAGTWSNIHNAAATSKALTAQTTGAYDYRVRACNDGGCADWSALASTVVSLSLGTPSLGVTPNSATQGDTLWAAWTSVSGATQYTLERSRNGNVFGTTYNGPATSATFTTGPSGDLRYRVKACNGSGCGPYSTEVEVYVQASTDLVAPPDEETDL